MLALWVLRHAEHEHPGEPSPRGPGEVVQPHTLDVVAVKCSATQVAISAAASLPPSLRIPSPLLMNQWIRPSVTYRWNSARVGEGSLPLNPPTGITGSRVASW